MGHVGRYLFQLSKTVSLLGVPVDRGAQFGFLVVKRTSSSPCKDHVVAD